MKILKIAIAFMAFVLATSVVPFASAEQADAQKPLYERLGGLKGITMVVDDFIDRLVANKTLNKNPAINAGRKSSPPPYLKFQVSQMVCEATGGPCKYTGKGMKESHAHLNITEKEWDVMAKDFQKSLDKFKVPATEQKELFEMVGKLKGDIVMKKG
jgi:hemoglobin